MDESVDDSNFVRNIVSLPVSTLNPPKIFKRRMSSNPVTLNKMNSNITKVDDNLMTAFSADFDEWSRNFIQMNRESGVIFVGGK